MQQWESLPNFCQGITATTSRPTSRRTEEPSLNKSCLADLFILKYKLREQLVCKIISLGQDLLKACGALYQDKTNGKKVPYYQSANFWT